MHLHSRAAAIAVCAALAACSGDHASDARLDRAAMERHVDALAVGIGSRVFDSPGSQRAAQYIIGELQRAGLEVEILPVGHIVHPPLRVLGRRVYRARHYDVRDPNLLVRIAPADPARARDPAVLLMAHYDTVPLTPGAVDNAAAIALLLELARIFTAAPPPRPLYLAWTAAEEIRLSGAVKLAEAIGDQVGVAVSLDLVGASDVVTLNGLSGHLGRDWLARLADAARRSGDVRAPDIYRVVSRLLPETERSDHGPFTNRGTPAFHIYSRGADRVFLPYHSPLDVPAEVDWDGVLGSGSFLTALIEDPRPLPETGGDPGWWLELPGGPRVLPMAVLIAAEVALAAIALAGLFMMFRRYRTNRRRALEDPDVAGLRVASSPPAAPGADSPLEPGAAIPRPRFPWLHGRGLLGFAVVYAIAWLTAAAALAIDRAAADHPAPWLHAPGTTYVALTAIAGGVALPLVWLIARVTSPRIRSGSDRFLAAAIVALLAAGTTPAALSAPELSLQPLAAAALLGTAAMFTRLRFALPLAIAGLAPLVAALDPGLAREGFFHAFLAPDFPVVLALAAVLLPGALVAVWAWQRWGLPLPRRGRAVVAVAVAPPVVAVLAAALLAGDAPPCGGAHFARAGLYCEIEPASSPSFPGPRSFTDEHTPE